MPQYERSPSESPVARKREPSPQRWVPKLNPDDFDPYLVKTRKEKLSAYQRYERRALGFTPITLIREAAPVVSVSQPRVPIQNPIVDTECGDPQVATKALEGSTKDEFWNQFTTESKKSYHLDDDTTEAQFEEMRKLDIRTRRDILLASTCSDCSKYNITTQI